MIFLPILLIGALLAYLFYFQRKTPYGMLDFRPALMLHFLPKDRDIEIGKVRNMYDKLTAKKNAQDKINLKVVRDIEVPFEDRSVVCRLYDDHPDEERPIIVFAHGGGWSIGSIATHERTAKKVCSATGYKVLSVEYSLAPEHPYPTALNEISTVVEYVNNNLSEFNAAQEIMIMGDSAGGHLAITAAINLIEQGKELITKIIAVYPVIDTTNTETESYNNFEKGYFLTKRMMNEFIGYYAPDPDDRRLPLASPNYYSDLGKLPDVYLITGQFDPLRDEGESFAKALTDAGVDCTFKRYDGVIHGFFANPMFGSKGDGAVTDLADYLHANETATTTT